MVVMLQIPGVAWTELHHQPPVLQGHDCRAECLIPVGAGIAPEGQRRLGPANAPPGSSVRMPQRLLVLAWPGQGIPYSNPALQHPAAHQGDGSGARIHGVSPPAIGKNDKTNVLLWNHRKPCPHTVECTAMLHHLLPAVVQDLPPKAVVQEVNVRVGFEMQLGDGNDGLRRVGFLERGRLDELLSAERSASQLQPIHFVMSMTLELMEPPGAHYPDSRAELCAIGR